MNLAIILPHVGLSMGTRKDAHAGMYKAREQHEFLPFRVERHAQGALYKLNYYSLTECLAAWWLMSPKVVIYINAKRRQDR